MKIYINLIILIILPFLAFSQWTDNSDWDHVGPFSVEGSAYESGKINSIELHPNYDGINNKTIYASGENGGLWYTVDEGEKWVNIPTNYLQYSGIGDIAITSDGKYLYASDRISLNSSTHRGNGVYKFDIENKQWVSKVSLDGLSNYRIKNNQLKIHPTDNATIFACTNRGIYRTIDGGDAWSATAYVGVHAGRGDGPKEVENVAFVPNPNSLGGYDIYAAGEGLLYISTDKGATFDDISNVSPYNPYSDNNEYYDIAYGGLDNDGTSHILFLYALNFPPETVGGVALSGALYKYVIPAQGAPTMNLLTEIGALGSMKCRMCIAGDKDVVYLGGDKLLKYNLVVPATWPEASGIYSPVQDYGRKDGHGFPNYSKIIHPDMNDIVMFDNETLHKIFVGTDGGFFINNYIPMTWRIDENYWVKRNHGMHISYIAGFSGSEFDENVYTTGEQDTKGFTFKVEKESKTLSKCVPFAVEPYLVMNDKMVENRIFHNYHLYENIANMNKIDYLDLQSNSIIESKNLRFCDPFPNLSIFLPDENSESDFIEFSDYSAFYQDPVRPQNIYAFAGGLWQFEETTQLFGLKFRTNHFNGNSDPLKRDEGMLSHINSMAVSVSNKNKIYLAGDNAYIYQNPDPSRNLASQIYRYYGSDIDDSWSGHKDQDWNLITPNLNLPPFNYGLSNDEVFQIRYKSIVMSDWNPDKLWVIAQGQNKNPINYHENLKVLLYIDGNWTDYSQNIPQNETPMSMVYERGSNDAIYLSTERAVYYRNASMSQWELFNSNLPHLWIPHMEINYKENTLRVGTYGRGIYKTNLHCPEGSLGLGCYDCPEPFYEASNVIMNEAKLYHKSTSVRAVDYIELRCNPNPSLQTSCVINPGNAGVVYEFFIKECGPTANDDLFKSYEEIDEDEQTEIANELEITKTYLFPNPNNGLFTVVSGSDNRKSIFVYDVLGKEVYRSLDKDTKKFEIDINSSPKGVYVVKVLDGNEVEILKVVNQ